MSFSCAFAQKERKNSKLSIAFVKSLKIKVTVHFFYCKMYNLANKSVTNCQKENTLHDFLPTQHL